MRYPLYSDLEDLLVRKLISKRPHPVLPLSIYNYTASAQSLSISDWAEALSDCRGLILDADGEIVGRPFKKFWGYERILDQIPTDEDFTVWEKCDGSLGILCFYAGEIVVATRGSFESEQAVWFKNWIARKPKLAYEPGLTYLFELVFPANRIVVDYGDAEEAFLLAVMDDSGHDLWNIFDNISHFKKAKRFDGVRDFSIVNSDPQFAGQEGFVVQWASGLRAKIKAEEYKRLHRLITQCSTRTIWEMLRTGADTAELLDRVPEDFKAWAERQIGDLRFIHTEITLWAHEIMKLAPPTYPRKDFAMWAKEQERPNLLFALLDGRDITDAIWKMVEPAWATPFRKDGDI